MANRIMTVDEANEYCRVNGYKMFIDMLIKDKVIVQDYPILTDEQQNAREKFRKALDDVGHSEATCYSHWVLEAYDKAFLPDFRK